MDCLPCEWNYRAAYCEAKTTEQKCLEGEETGVRLLHGTSYRFMKENVTSMFQAVYKAFEQVRLFIGLHCDDYLKKIVSMTWKFHSHTLQTNPCTMRKSLCEYPGEGITSGYRLPKEYWNGDP